MVAALVAAIVCLAALPATAAATSVTVSSTQKFTPTGVTVHKGDRITVTASGHVHFGGHFIDSLDPNGIAAGEKCNAINQRKKLSFPAQGLACWSLIARIRHSAQWVEIGTKKIFTADHDGELLLAVNDNFRNDNSGTWTAQVSVTPAGTAPPPSKSSGNGALVLVAIFGGLIAAALLLFFLLRRRRPTEEGEPGTPKAAPEPALVGPAAAAGAAAAAVAPHYEPEPETPPAPVIPTAPPDPESIDVNIFEVEFTNGLQMRVGYNHFPDGTLLNWKVTQGRKPVAVGSFITQGGGSTNHHETVPLGLKLEGRDSEPDGADVQFDWSINGVPFRYSVRRDPNC